MPDIPDAIRVLERDLRTIFGTRLQSLVAYGLRRGADSSNAHDHDRHAPVHQRPLTHTLAVVDAIGVDDLRACARQVAKWHDAGLATPLLLAAHEFENSLDAFPFEFGAIVADHTVIAGRNPFDRARVEVADLRRACEIQARSHLLHLREGFLETRDHPDALAELIVQSAAPFAALLESLARLQSVSATDRSAIGRHVERTLQVPGGVITGVMQLAKVTEISAAEATRIFPAYLDAAERLVAFVDGWSHGSR